MIEDVSNQTEETEETEDKEHPKKSLYDVIAIILLASFVLVLFFLFWGEPDVWDALRQKIMN